MDRNSLGPHQVRLLRQLELGPVDLDQVDEQLLRSLVALTFVDTDWPHARITHAGRCFMIEAGL